jgi:hypothetical protein
MKCVQSADAAVDFISQWLPSWAAISSTDCRRQDLDVATYNVINRYVDPDYLYQLIVNDDRYKEHNGITEGMLPSFEEQSLARGGKHSDLSSVGNEQTDAFRNIVAKRFVYFFEAQPLDVDITNGNSV